MRLPASLPMRVVAVQAMVAGAATLIWWVLSGTLLAVSALVAGLAVLVPNAMFALRVSQAEAGADNGASAQVGAKAAEAALAEASAKRLLVQGFVKFGVTVMLLAGALAFVKPDAMGFFSAFIAVIAVQLFAPLLDPLPRRPASVTNER